MFQSTQHPGVVMNRYGVALKAGRVQDADTHAAVIREALAAGWRLVPSHEPDVGREWISQAKRKSQSVT